MFNLRTQRWQEMWDLQQAVYEWPATLGEDQIAKVKDLKFGDDISDSSFLSIFRDHYAKEYETVAKEAAPIQFAGGWQAVLRPVPAWKRNPESEDVWLATEDYWVERELLRALASVNKERGPQVADRGGERLAVHGRPEANGRTTRRSGRSSAGPGRLDLKLDRRAGRPDHPGVDHEPDRPATAVQRHQRAAVQRVPVRRTRTPSRSRSPIEGTSLEGGKTEPIKYVEQKHTVLEGRAIERSTGSSRCSTSGPPRSSGWTSWPLGYTSARHSQAELQMPPSAPRRWRPPRPRRGGGAGSPAGRPDGRARRRPDGRGRGTCALRAAGPGPGVPARRVVHRTSRTTGWPGGATSTGPARSGPCRSGWWWWPTRRSSRTC